MKAGVAILVVAALAFGVVTWWNGRTDAVFESVIDPVEVTIRPPQYVVRRPGSALDSPVPGGLLARQGVHERLVRTGANGLWLPDGRLVVTTGEQVRCPDGIGTDCVHRSTGVLTPATGGYRGLPGAGETWNLPGEAVHRLNIVTGRPTSDVPMDVYLSYASDLASHEDLAVPTNPDGGSMLRSLGERVFSIGRWDYLQFSDGDEESRDEYGFLRHRRGTDRWEKVLLGQRLVALWVSRDGRALLGLQQNRGEPCGGCVKTQQIVEIDPEAGEIVATYGTPDSYDKTWRVAVLDKNDGRVLVRYVHRRNNPENLGVWQYDGDWSLVPGTDRAFTWWQGPDDRIEARPTSTDPEAEDAAYRLFWVHDGRATRLKGEMTPFEVAEWRGAPGSLVPLD